jgi:hypothetical protein
MALFWEDISAPVARSSYGVSERTYDPAMEQGFGGGQLNQNLQQQLAMALMGNAYGGNSVAQMQLQQSRDANNAAVAGNMAGQRGINPALAARLQSQALSQNNAMAAQQMAQLRAQEQLAAQQALSQHLAQSRGQDLSQYMGAGQLKQGAQGINAQQAMGNAQIEQNANNFNAQLKLNQRQGDVTNVSNMVKSAGEIAGKVATGMADGGLVPGDSPQNDIVPAMLSPGEAVIPRSVMQSPDAPDEAASFVEALQRQQRAQTGEGYGRVLSRQRGIEARLMELERILGGR